MRGTVLQQLIEFSKEILEIGGFRSQTTRVVELAGNLQCVPAKRNANEAPDLFLAVKQRAAGFVTSSATHEAQMSSLLRVERFTIKGEN